MAAFWAAAANILATLTMPCMAYATPRRASRHRHQRRRLLLYAVPHARKCFAAVLEVSCGLSRHYDVIATRYCWPPMAYGIAAPRFRTHEMARRFRAKARGAERRRMTAQHYAPRSHAVAPFSKPRLLPLARHGKISGSRCAIPAFDTLRALASFHTLPLIEEL